MEVKEYIKNVLTDIMEGVAESGSEDYKFMVKDGGSAGIDFDISVVAKESAEGKIGAEILSIGAKTEGSISQENINRIKFKVIPYTKREKFVFEGGIYRTNYG
ncbi:MAG: trypco2 family protein [bacterium]